jgi:hypothetical protein
MRYRFFFLILSFFLNDPSWGRSEINLSPGFSSRISEKFDKYFSLSEGQLNDLLKGEVVSTGKVDSPTPDVQVLTLFVSGVHPRNCTKALRKLSLYENYHNYMDFIKTSKYDEKTQKFTFTVDHTLLPFPMIVGFKIPRITKEGHYPFVFEDGFLKDLKGTVIAQEMGKYCLLGLKADWKGPKSKIPNVVFATFVQTIGRIGLENLIRISTI